MPADGIEFESVHVPGQTPRVHAIKYRANRDALLRALPDLP